MKNNEGFEKGLTIEHVLLSITIVSNKESAGQFDDSCAYQVQKAMNEYHGVERVDAEVLYKHTKIEQHSNGCSCGYCKPEKDTLEDLPCRHCGMQMNHVNGVCVMCGTQFNEKLD